MYRLGVDTLVCLLWICCAVTMGTSDIDMLTKKPTRCSHERAFDMYGAYCGGLRLSKIPDLKSSIEILDFSENRLQEIEADTFSNYPNIKYLYLTENQLYRIDEQAFAPLNYLQTLDLSNNVILKLPGSIFELPSLRNLYLKNNPLLHLSISSIEINKPIKAPLEMLDISNCKLSALPDWGVLPHLLRYNISHNSLRTIDAEHFAAMCSLHKVDLTKSIQDVKTCDLKPTINWFQIKAVYMELDDYTKLNSKEFENCHSMTDNDLKILNATHQRCKTTNLKIHSAFTSRRTWLTVTGGLAGFLVGFMLLLYIFHRHNVMQSKSPAEKITKITPKNECDKHASIPILNESNDISRL